MSNVPLPFLSRSAFLLAVGPWIAACVPATISQQAASSENVAAVRAVLQNIERVFDAGDVEAAAEVFADDAMILAEGLPEVVGRSAIHDLYADMLVATTVSVRFNSEEMETFGDLAYERGTYVLTISDKVTGQTLQTATNRHVHVFKRQRSGEWKTWRMITNSATATPAAVQ